MEKKRLIFWQAIKFILVGGLNTIIDLGVLNLLMFIFGIASGIYYSLFKSISFTIAVINSYLWNKFWVFDRRDSNAKKEFFHFWIISLVGFGINVGVASFVVNLIGSQFELSLKIWANIGALIATFCAMFWNFFGYKFIIFKR